MNDRIRSGIPRIAKPKARFAPGADIPLSWVRGARKKSVTERRLDIAINSLRAIFCCIILYLLFLSLHGDFEKRKRPEGSGGARPQRADIVDRNGQPLAVNLPTIDLWANTKNLVAPDESARALARILPELEYGDAIAKLRSGKGFVYLARNVAPAVREKVLLIGEPGLEFAETGHRFYPQGSLFSHIVGAVDVDNNGISGVEKYLDENGMSRVREPVRLSVDIYVQDAMRQNLARAMKDYGAKTAAGITMDVKSGEILGMVSLPDFYGKDAGKAASSALYNNHATTDVFEIGSVMKIFNHALAIESRYPAKKTFNVCNPFAIGGHKVRDSHPRKCVIDMREAFILSSNIAAATIARELGSERQREFFRKLGFFSRANLELPERGAPMFPKKWDDNVNQSAAYGYGISISLLHTIAAAGAIINDGMYVPPTILKRREGEAPRSHQAVRLSTSEEMKRLMRLAVTDGTGRMANLADIKTGGKTGTSYKMEGGKYNERKIRTFFVSVFPIDDPKYIMAVMLDEADNDGCTLASCTAVPASKKIIEEIGPTLNLDIAGR
ncbi:MAG: penicillin-binding protein 2 [Rickettsiales bacterium]|nr:penicillin-binding protein 2 [Rickettsiales bacterium]